MSCKGGGEESEDRAGDMTKKKKKQGRNQVSEKEGIGIRDVLKNDEIYNFS